MNRHNVSLAISAGRQDQLLRDKKPQIAFVGRSNVGKSSALNRLLGRKSLARVSGTPGKTVTVNYFNLDGKCYLVDLPGYGYARRSASELKAFRALTDAYFRQVDDLILVLQLVDLKTGPSADDRMMISFLTEAGIPFVIVATKLDKLNKTGQQNNIKALEEEFFPTPVFPLSSLDGTGAERIWALLESAVENANEVTGG